MRNIRNCTGGNLDTGVSKCPIDLANIIGAIVVEPGMSFPADATAASIKQACHADRPNRLMPIMSFVEYAKDGGEPNVSSVGYGGNQVTNIGARTDTFTLDKCYTDLAAQLNKAVNKKFEVFYFDENNVVYGLQDGDNLRGFPLTTLYPTVTPHPTSSNPATLTVSFAFVNARDAIENFDYLELDFNLKNSLVGLTAVKLVATGAANKYKIIEAQGGYDLTSKFGSTIASNAQAVLNNVTAATYDSATETLTLTTSEGNMPSLKAPSALYTAEIEGIVSA